MWNTKLWAAGTYAIGAGVLLLATGCGDVRQEDGPSSKPPTLELATVEEKLTSQEWPVDPLVVTNSIQLDQRGQFQGNVAVTKAAGSVLAHAAEVALELNSRITGSVRADTLYLATDATVTANATYNSKQGPGKVLGTLSTPLSLPLPITLPQLPTFSAGSPVVTLASNEVRDLLAGNYGAVTLPQSNTGGTTKLNLLGGTYAFASITVGTDARIECKAECEVRVVGQVSSAARSYFGPATVAGMGPGNVRLLVKGSNTGGTPTSTPSACTFQNDATLAAWTLVPNGTLRLGQRVTAKGKFVARDAVIGTDSGGKGLELPIVVQAPQDKTVWEHQSTTFTVTATGTGVTYQWQKNGVNIPNANSAALTITNAAIADDQAKFRVVLTNEAGSVTTGSAVLKVIPVVQPKVACVLPSVALPSGGFSTGQAVFGYNNPGGVAIDIPVGVRNHVSLSNGSGAQPVTSFVAAGAAEAFIATLPDGGTATWTLEGVSVTATEQSPKCNVPPFVPSSIAPNHAGDHVGDYNPALPSPAPYTFDGIQGFYSTDFRVPPGWRQQLGSLELLDIQPPPGTPPLPPSGAIQSFSFENFSWIDDNGERDHLRVLVFVNDQEKGVADCPRAIHFDDEVDLGSIVPGEFDPTQPNLARINLVPQFRRCPAGDIFDDEDCYWKTLGNVTATVTLDDGRTISFTSSSDYCVENGCSFFVAAAPDIGRTRIRYEDFDGVNDVFNIDFWSEVTPQAPPEPPPPTPPAPPPAPPAPPAPPPVPQLPPPTPPGVAGTPAGLCVRWNTSLIEDMAYWDRAAPDYPAAFAEFWIRVAKQGGEVFELGRLDLTSTAEPTFLDVHGCIPFADAGGNATEFFDALVTPDGGALPSIDFRVSTRFRKPAGAGFITYDVYHRDGYALIADEPVKENGALALLDDGDASTRNNLVLIFRTDDQAATLPRDGFTSMNGFQVPPSPWILGPTQNPTAHPMLEVSAVVSQALRSAGPTQFRPFGKKAGAPTSPVGAHLIEVGPGCPGGNDIVDPPAMCTGGAGCSGQPNGKLCGVATGATVGVCGCQRHSDCPDGRTCAVSDGATFGTCTVNQADSCALQDEQKNRVLFMGPATLPAGAKHCSTTTPCPGHQECLKRTPTRRNPGPGVDNDIPVDNSNIDNNVLAVTLTKCQETDEDCMCHLPDQTRWKFVTAHEMGHDVQDHAGTSFNLAGYGFECPTSDPNCPADGAQSRSIQGDLFDPPGISALCGCDHVTEANRLHCLQSLERTPSAFVEGYAQFFASAVFNDPHAATASEACTFMYYKSLRDVSSTVYEAPVAVSCAATDRWRNNQCPEDVDMSTERDWMQFLWGWHTTALEGDLGKLDQVLRGACGCTKVSGSNSSSGTDSGSEVIVTCEQPQLCPYNPVTQQFECDPTQTCQPGAPNCDAPIDCNGNMRLSWDWPNADSPLFSSVPSDQHRSLREGVIWYYSGGKSSTEPGLNPDSYPGYTDFNNLSRTRGVNREMDLQ